MRHKPGILRKISVHGRDPIDDGQAQGQVRQSGQPAAVREGALPRLAQPSLEGTL